MASPFSSATAGPWRSRSSLVAVPEASFVGNICGNYNELVELCALAARNAVALTTTTFPLEGVNDALHALDGGRLIGRGVLVRTGS